MTAYKGGSSVGAGRTRAMKWVTDSGPTAIFEFGCGRGDLGRALRKACPHAFIEACDSYLPVVEMHQQNVGNPFDRVRHSRIEDAARAASKGCPNAPLRPWLWAFGDTLEHLPRALAFELLLNSPADLLYIAIPVGSWPQKPKKANPDEEHLWSFYPQDLLELAGTWTVENALIKGSDKMRRLEFTDLEDQAEYGVATEFIGNFLLRRVR